MKIYSIILLLLVSSTNIAFASTPILLDDFSSLKVVGLIEVDLEPANVNSIKIDIIRGDEKNLKYVIDSEGQLKIFFKKSSNFSLSQNKAKVILKYKSIGSIKALASAKIRSSQAIEVDNLTLLCSSSAYMELRLKVNSLDVSSSAGAKVVLSGDAHFQVVKAASGSKYIASELYCNIANVNALSGATASVWVTKEITGKSNSGGKLSFKGNPKKQDIKGAVYGRKNKN